MPVRLKGPAADPKRNEVTLATRALLYSGALDTDELRLTCLPAAL